jgi:PAS domain S-box-containing protein
VSNAPADERPPGGIFEELRASREIFRLLVEGTPDYAIFMLDPEGRVQTWNSGARRLKGYEADEVIGRHFSLFYPAEDREKAERGLEIARTYGRYEEDGWRVRKDGSRFCASVIITAVYEAQGGLTGFSKVTRDITDRRIAETVLREEASELERRVEQRTSQLKMANEQLEAFAYSVSHDLRSPLLGLQGLATVLLEDYGERLDDLGREYVRTMATTAQGLVDLIQNLLEYSRLGAVGVSLLPVDPRLALRDALASLGSEIEISGGHISVPDRLPMVVGHPPTLAQIFLNLLSNGLKFVPPGCRPEIRVEAEPRGSFVRLWVRDNGIGISPEYHGRIFKVFERLHGTDTFPGNGVGLAIVAAGVRSMGGRVGVESGAGAGSSFWFELHGDASHEGSDSDRRRQPPRHPAGRTRLRTGEGQGPPPDRHRR